MSAIWKEAVYLFFLCWVIAKLEIQIEGPNGWAEKLPTWRTAPNSWVNRLLGKPLTGYHVYFMGMLIILFHLPILFTGFSWSMEGRVLSLFFLTTVFWDFQWFLWNPAWGVKRYFREPIPWFPRRFLKLPREYFKGVSLAFAATALLAPERLVALSILTVMLVLISTATAVISVYQNPAS